jgi:spore coat protein H
MQNRWTSCGVLSQVVWLLGGCGQEAAPSNQAPPAATDPDYQTVFPQDRVENLDLVIAPSDWQALWDDMTELAGPFGAGGPAMGAPVPGGAVGSAPIGGGPDGRPSGGATIVLPPELTAACADKAEGDACEAAVGGMTVRGHCRQGPMGGGLACLPEEEPMGRGGPGGGRPDGEFLSRTPKFVPARLTFAGRTLEQVGLRLKGNSTLMNSWHQGVHKLPFRIDMDELEEQFPAARNQRLFGFKLLSLTPSAMDRSLVREKLVADLLRQAGVPAASTTFVRLFIDHGTGRTYFGLYAMVEVPDKPFLRSRFGSDEGNLYKPQGPAADLTRFEPASFEKKTNERAADWSDVQRFIVALHGDRTDAATWRHELESTFAVNEFLRWLAANTVIVNWDTYGALAHNYFLYGNPNDGGRLHWIPWDHDLAMVAERGPADLLHEQTDASWPLIRFLLDDPVYRAAYLGHVRAVLEKIHVPADLERRLATAKALISPYVVGPEGELPGYTHLRTPAEFESAHQELVDYARTRERIVREALAGIP